MPDLRWLSLVLVALLALTGCPGDDDDSAAPDDDDDSAEPAQYPTVYCPGDPSGMCEPGGDTALLAGAAAVSITPTCWEDWTDVNGNDEYGITEGDTFEDCGCDQLCAGDDGYPGADEYEGDGVFQAVWLAGSSQGRALKEIHDELWVRAIVLSQGESSIAILSADLVGYSRRPIKDIQEQIRQTTDVDYVLWSSTHTHQGPDTLGIWGPALNTSGVVDWYYPQVAEAGIAAIEEAAAAQVPVDLSVAEYDIADSDCEGQGINNFNEDHRDPNITDERIFSVLLTETATGNTVASVVNWPNHPEVMIDEIIQTSGFAHYWREGLENGVQTPDGLLPGLGGTAVYVQGMCGGMMTPLGTDPFDLFGVQWFDYSFDMVKAQGDYLAAFSLNALMDATPVADPQLTFRFKEVGVPVENEGYWLYLNLGVLDRELFTFEIPDPDGLIGEDNMPIATTEVGVIELGPIEIVTVPGEMLPEIGIGGYDGSHTGPLQSLLDEGENAPDLGLAPDPPYLVDLMDGEYKLFFGLANDELGYIIPDFQYLLGDPPYLSEAPGDHYEETNSVGPTIAGLIEDTAENLLLWEFPE